MLTAHRLFKVYDSQTIFHNVTFSLNPGERLGLVGPNGCGKSTLLRILAGLEAPSAGHVQRAPGLRLGYLPQGYSPDPALTLGESLSQLPSAEAVYAELEDCATALAQSPADPALQERYDSLARQAAAAGDGRRARLLGDFGLDQLDPGLPVRLLSGGQQTRLALARLLLAEPELLLLDEPTNHLDIAMLEWLEGWLSNSPCGMLIVSHDRAFLDHNVTGILEMDPRRQAAGSLHAYNGNYSTYLEQRQAEIAKQWGAYRDQQQEVQRLQADIERTKEQARYTERQASSVRIGGSDMKQKGFKSYQQGIAKKVAAKAKARETRLERYLDSDERVERPQESWQARRSLHLAFEPEGHAGRLRARLENASLGYHPDSPLLSGLNLSIYEPVGGQPQRIAVSGPNGSGKTTLLRSLAGQIPLLAGTLSLGPSVRLGVMSQDQSNLDSAQTPVQTLLPYLANETRARSFLAQFLLTGDEALKLNTLLSYGQRSRLELARLVAQGCNFLLLDEPVNHLDIPSRVQFEAALETFPGAVLAVVHDRYFIERFASEIWWVEAGEVRREMARVLVD